VAPPVKLPFALCSLLFVSACSTFGGSASNVDPESYAAAQSQLTVLENEVSRLESENARLTEELQTARRLSGKVALADETPAPDDLALRDGAAARLPDQPTISAPDAQEPAEITITVVDDMAPDLKKDDVPVEPAPRLVQPTFASTDAVFENEADDEGEIETASVMYGVHLASYRKIENAREGWRKLQRDNPDELGLLEPRIEPITIQDKGGYLRLIGGGLSSKEKAASLCAKLEAKDLYCTVTSFNGERLSLAEGL